MHLEASRGQFVSGAQIAAALSISRNAIWKAVRELEKSGYQIEASPRKGYRLSDQSDILTKEGIFPLLKNEAKDVSLLFFDSLPSTNQYAKQLAVSHTVLHIPFNTIVFAETQTAGRGRWSHQFYSPSKSGLYFSLLLSPERFSFPNPTFVTLFAAVAVCEAIEEVCGVSPQIKWVNDLYLNGKKICGILTEAAGDFESRKLQWIICGIGLNIYPPVNGFPESLPAAGALFPNKEKAPLDFSRSKLAAAILNRFLLFQTGQTGKTEKEEKDDLIARYQRRCMLSGRNVLIQESESASPYLARVIEVDADGCLEVELEDHQRRHLLNGHIELLD